MSECHSTFDLAGGPVRPDDLHLSPDDEVHLPQGINMFKPFGATTFGTMTFGRMTIGILIIIVITLRI